VDGVTVSPGGESTDLGGDGANPGGEDAGVDGLELSAPFLGLSALIVVMRVPILEVRTTAWISSIRCVAASILVALDGLELRALLVLGGEARETSVAARVLGRRRVRRNTVLVSLAPCAPTSTSHASTSRDTASMPAAAVVHAR
jgi:hypothetical protein